MKARHAIGLALTIFLCGAIRVIAGQQATFKGAVRTVAIYATALRDTTLVSDLQRDDFRVDDNGKLQELTQFANDIQPITVVLLLDRSGSMRANFELVEKAAETFVQNLGPRDKARIGSFSNRIQLDPRQFTGDHGILLGILRQELQEEGPTPLWNAVNVGITALLHEEGRRVILVFTDGVDEPMNPGANSNSLSGVMHRADEENVMVYAIGLSGTNGRPAMPPGMGRGGTGRYGGMARPGPPRVSGPDPGLKKISHETGGGYFELTGAQGLGDTFKRVIDELHHQYLLGFSPTVLDGKRHKLTVTAKDPGVTVRARQSYVAAQER